MRKDGNNILITLDEWLILKAELKRSEKLLKRKK
jgi:hypothetical protein